MIEDPCYTKDSPFRLLGLSFSPSLAEVQTALPRWIAGHKRQLHMIGRAQEAVKCLQSARARAAIEIWYYHPAEVSVKAAPATTHTVENISSVPIFPPSDLYTDLLAAQEAPGPSAGEAPALDFPELSGFDPIDGLPVRPEFDA